MLKTRFLGMIKCKREKIGKSDLTSGNAYKITLSYNGNWCSFVFNDNFKNRSTKKDFLYCLYLDAMAYENVRDVFEFAREFGYADWQKARKPYSACKAQSVRLHKLFNEQEIEILSEIE